MANSIITALFGLLGVLIGGWISSANQAKERRHNRIREQIDGLYSPLLGIRMQILAKSETRLKVTGAVGEAWRNLVEHTSNYSIEDQIKTDRERFPDFEKVIEDNNRRFVEALTATQNPPLVAT